MVKLTRIYTRGGDGGETSLGDGARVAKHTRSIEAIGAVDEANAAIGLARIHLENGVESQIVAMLDRIQNDLFDLGADLCRPEGAGKEGALRITAAQAARLEGEIDALNEDLAPLSSFVLPGGTPGSAYVHMARTVVRRAERRVTALASVEPVNLEAIVYINRLSDHLFVLARTLNDTGKNDVLWRPGENR